MDLKQKLVNRLGVPENWDKYDYQTQRYSFDDMHEVLTDIVENLSIHGVVKSLPSKQAMSFSEWKIIKFEYNNGLYNDLVDRRKFYTQAQILKKYNKEILN